MQTVVDDTKQSIAQVVGRVDELLSKDADHRALVSRVLIAKVR
jgi:hypothetical protein